MSQASYYMHITTTARNAYPRSHNKFSWYFHLKVIYNMLYYHRKALWSIFVFYDFLSKKTCQYHVWLSENIASFIQWPNITINSFCCYTQVLFIMTTYNYNYHRNFVPQVVVIHRFDCIQFHISSGYTKLFLHFLIVEKVKELIHYVSFFKNLSERAPQKCKMN